MVKGAPKRTDAPPDAPRRAASGPRGPHSLEKLGKLRSLYHSAPERTAAHGRAAGRPAACRTGSPRAANRVVGAPFLAPA